MNKISKKIVLLSALFAAIIMMTGCPQLQQSQLPAEETCVVTFYPQQDAEGVALTVEKGDTLKTIADKIPEPKNADSAFKFVAWVTADGKEFPADKPILNDISLYAKFEKTTTEETTPTGTHQESQTQTTDGSSSTVTTETQTTDGSSSTVTTETTTLEDGTQVVETTETVTDSQWNTTTTETSVSTDPEGNTTIGETVTDPEGNTTTEITTSEEVTSKKLIELGLNSLKNGNLNLAKSYFNEAYEKNSSDDEALLYSALSDLTSIITNKGIQDFFENHIGIKDYPSTLDDLITGNWLTSTEYNVEGTGYLWCDEFEEVDNPVTYEECEDEEGNVYREPVYDWYYYRAKLTDKSETEDNVYRVSYYYTTIEIDGKKHIVSSAEKNNYDDLMQGRTEYLFGVNWIHSRYESYPANFELDNDGDYYIHLYQRNVPEGYTAYRMYNDYYYDV